MIAAAIEGWDYPMSREAAIFADLYDLEYAKTGVKSRKPYPRPYRVKRAVEHHGDNGGRSRAEVVAWLQSLGHNVN